MIQAKAAVFEAQHAAISHICEIHAEIRVPQQNPNHCLG